MIQTWIEKDSLLSRYIVEAGQMTRLVDIARPTSQRQISVFIDPVVTNGDYVLNLEGKVEYSFGSVAVYLQR